MDGCTLWHRDGLHVWADWGDDGRLVIQGQALGRGLGGATEYEYGITVHPADVPRLVAALGLESADDVMEFLEANGESIALQNECKWLESLGVTPEFWSRVEFDD